MTDTEANPAADLQRRLHDLRTRARAELDRAQDGAALEQWRIEHLGRKSALSDLLGGMGKLAADERKLVGSTANEVKRDLEQAFSSRETELHERQLADSLEHERIDV